MTRRSLCVVAGGVFLCVVGAILGQRQIKSYQIKSSPSGLSPILTRKNVVIPPALAARLVRASRFAEAANAAMAAGDYAAAEADAEQSLEIDGATPGMDEVYAAALNAQGKTEEALAAYKYLSDCGGWFPDNELPYALLLLKTGHWTEAVEAYDRQLPSDGDNWLMRSHRDFSPEVPRSKELAAAIHIGLGLDSGWPGYHGSDAARYRQSLGQFKQALALEPDSALTVFYYGYGLRQTGRWREADAAFEKAAAMDRGDVRQAAEDCLAHRK